MLKEIYEQPEVIRTCFEAYFSASSEPKISTEPEQIHILACGTSRHAGLVAQHWFEQLAQLPTRVRSASEFPTTPLPLTPKTWTIAATQSGETADTLAAVEADRQRRAMQPDADRAQIIGITNHAESSLAHHVDRLLPILAGPEMGVAATKTFTAQLMVFLALAVELADTRGTLSAARKIQVIAELQALPDRLTAILKQADAIQGIAQQLATVQHCIIVGSGMSRAIALEAALKLKETTYLHAEGYAAGEFLHGPIALLDASIPVIAIVPTDQATATTLKAVNRVNAFNVRTIGITNTQAEFDHTLLLPATDPLLSPFLTILPLQLLAYYIAIARGLDVDRPRHITKTLL